MNNSDQNIIGLLAMHPEGLSASELRREIYPPISQPTLWRRLETLRALGKVKSSGRNRSTRYHSVSSDHDIVDLRSKALHLAVGKKLLRQPQGVEMARGRLEQMRVSVPYAKTYIDQWASLLSGPIEDVLRVLGADDENAVALRHTSPFTSLLSERERLAVLRKQGLLR